jgi:hypothetical protein
MQFNQMVEVFQQNKPMVKKEKQKKKKSKKSAL